MAETLVKLTDNLETTFTGLGLGDGPFAPVARFGAGFIMGTVIYGFFSPRLSYNADGTKRPWAILDNNPQSGGTYFPWWAPGVGLGTLFGAFI